MAAKGGRLDFDLREVKAAPAMLPPAPHAIPEPRSSLFDRAAGCGLLIILKSIQVPQTSSCRLAAAGFARKQTGG
tara:strand:- start:2438 stop:2662 length:225 start_codon:yes stop_codon:yes gene_type:complete